MQRLMDKIQKLSPDEIENWVRFSQFKMILREEGKSDLRNAFLFFIGKDNISLKTILDIDPLQELIAMVNEFYADISSMWEGVISTDELLPIIINLIPQKTDTHELQLFSHRLEILVNIIKEQYGYGIENYSFSTLLSCVTFKLENISSEKNYIAKVEEEIEKKECEKVIEKKIDAIVAKILLKEQAVLPPLLKEEKPVLPTVDDEEEGVPSKNANEIIYGKCLAIYNKVFEDPCFLSTLEELCSAHISIFEMNIKDELQENSVLFQKYFEGKKSRAGCIEIVNDALDPMSEIARFIIANPLLIRTVENFRLACSLLNAVKPPAQAEMKTKDRNRFFCKVQFDDNLRGQGVKNFISSLRSFLP